MSETGYALGKMPEPQNGEEVKECLRHSREVLRKAFGDLFGRTTYDFALEYIEMLESAQPKWISVDADQRPRHGKEYLCVCSLPDDPKHEWDWMDVLRWFAHGTNGFVDRPHFTNEGLNGMIVTHWMELPKRPKEEK